MKWVSVDEPTWYANFPMYWECADGHLHIFKLMAWICERRSKQNIQTGYRGWS